MHPIFPITRYMLRLPIDYLKLFRRFQLLITVPATGVGHSILSTSAQEPQAWRPFPGMNLQHVRSEAVFSSCNTRYPHDLPNPNSIFTSLRHPDELGNQAEYLFKGGCDFEAGEVRLSREPLFSERIR
jgi:hypothetical protein